MFIFVLFNPVIVDQRGVDLSSEHCVTSAHYRSLPPTTMVSTRRSTKSREISQEGGSSGDSGGGRDPGERSRPASTRSPKSRASIKHISKQKGKQLEKRRNIGKLLKSPVLPLDVLYEVIYGPVHIADGMPADAFVGITSCPSSGSTADVVDQQNLS